ncbi:MAG: hypothetical protein DME90_05605 [Verrucomicrobia bacterium]|nr:MAG: hypothetical protein DME90_05605 [Verrucomicrobiota bacterium]
MISENLFLSASLLQSALSSYASPLDLRSACDVEKGHILLKRDKTAIRLGSAQFGGRKPNSACKSPRSHFTKESFSIDDASAAASASA